MNQFNWIDAFNSMTTFAILTVIAVGIWLLLAKKERETRSKPSKR